MDAKKLKIGTTYYCLIGGLWYPNFAIVKAKYINNAGWTYNNRLVVMEQNVDGVVHRFETTAEKIYPADKEILSAVLHNERQRRRILEHDKAFNHKNAREKIERWIATLPETDQKALRVKYRQAYPGLVKKDGSFFSSKFNMANWYDLMSLYFDYKYPKVKIPVISELNEKRKRNI